MNDKKKLQDEITTLDYELKVELPKEILKAKPTGPERECRIHAARGGRAS